MFQTNLKNKNNNMKKKMRRKVMMKRGRGGQRYIEGDREKKRREREK